MSKETMFTTQIGDHDIEIATGRLAQMAGGSVTLRERNSMVMAAATMSKNAREGLDFFPLSVDFEEKMYAAGRIPGGFFRREGRASTDAILTARLTDRPLRPLFPDGMRNEVQVIVYALASDTVSHLDIMAVNASSAALTISNIPWNGPIGAVRVGYIDGKLVANPSIPEMEASTLDLRMACTKDAIIMVEAGAAEVDEALMVEALTFGHEAVQPFITTLTEMREQIGKEKSAPIIQEKDEELATAVANRIGDRIKNIVATEESRAGRNAAMDILREEIVESFVADDADVNTREVRNAISSILKKAIRDRILYEGIRPDGRDYTTIRALSSDINITPQTHGSGLFQRGETQVLSLATLGMPREAQKIDGLYPVTSRRYMHHYNFPPFSTGETWFLRGPKRREIGHGALAETALRYVIPSEEEFPYTIRVVSEVLASNGSTSQASVCASSLALMDCGVPIKAPVGGIAMGLISDGEQSAILTDIQGLEDHLGDMDFKVAGSRNGITALQMDIKIDGLSKELMAQALEQARVARMEILDVMATAIAAPRPELSDNAPRMMAVHINPEKIGAVIGKGGSMIRSLEETFEVSIDIQEDGTVLVAGDDGAKTAAAATQIENLVKEAKAGQTYTGKVVRITDFGAFIEIIPGTDGLVHISQLSNERVRSVADEVQLGDQVMVMVTDVTPDGKVRLSRKAVIMGWTLEEAQADDQPKRGGGNRSRRGNDRSGGNRNRRR